MNFAHLHVHRYFSLFDDAAPADELVEAIRDALMDAVALTDHNSSAGTVRFYQAAMAVGVKPIIGVGFDVETARIASRKHPKISQIPQQGARSAFDQPGSRQDVR